MAFAGGAAGSLRSGGAARRVAAEAQAFIPGWKNARDAIKAPAARRNARERNKKRTALPLHCHARNA